MRFAVAAVAVAAVLAIGAAASARSGVHGVPHGFRPQTAAAVGSRDYWVLGYYACGGRSCAALVRSTDRGRHFERVALPWRSPRVNLPTLTFVNSRLGYLLGGRLYITTDGGTSWHPSGPRGGREFAVGGRDVYVLSKNRLVRSPIGRSSWQTVPLPVRYRFVVSLAARGRKVWLLGSTSHIRAGDVTLRSSDAGAIFKTSHGPCIPELGGRLVPAGRGVVWAVCPSGMMAGLSLSTNGGRTFPRYRSLHDPGGTRLPALTNGGGIFPSSPRAAVLYRGASGPLFRTTDMGRRWISVPRTGRLEQLMWLGFATSRVGVGLFTTKPHPNQASLWRTTDRGATWHSMPIR
ncbi:MAG: WD40/YVTN/BNR-like repeat-containing protein [Candidatus Lutacidiplasmatales archaeon]